MKKKEREDEGRQRCLKFVWGNFSTKRKGERGEKMPKVGSQKKERNLKVLWRYFLPTCWHLENTQWHWPRQRLNKHTAREREDSTDNYWNSGQSVSTDRKWTWPTFPLLSFVKPWKWKSEGTQWAPLYSTLTAKHHFQSSVEEEEKSERKRTQPIDLNLI